MPFGKGNLSNGIIWLQVTGHLTTSNLQSNRPLLGLIINRRLPTPSTQFDKPLPFSQKRKLFRLHPGCEFCRVPELQLFPLLVTRPRYTDLISVSIPVTYISYESGQRIRDLLYERRSEYSL